MREKAVLRTLSELDRWKRRREDLRAELEKVERQITYYEALSSDMKKEIRPARTVDFFKMMFKF